MTVTTNTSPAPFAGAQRAAQYDEHLTPSEPALDQEASSKDETSAATRTALGETNDSRQDESIDRADLGALSASNPRRFATTGLRGVLGRVGIRLAPNGAELAEIDRRDHVRKHEDVVRQATWTRAVSILVANPKGGVGKTPISLLLGGALASIRGGSVCVVEVSDDPGALTFRSEGNPTRGIGELVRDVDSIRTAGQLAGYTAPQTSFAAVIGSVGSRPRLDGKAVNQAATVIDDYFSIRVMDSGNQPSSPAFRAAVESADVLVIPTFNSGDSALEATALIDTMTAAGGHAAELAANAIVVRLQDGRPENVQVVGRIDRILAGYVDHTHAIAYDAHIAERGQLSLHKLERSTRDAFTRVAADVVRSLQTTVR